MIIARCDGCGKEVEISITITNGIQFNDANLWWQYSDPKNLPRVIDYCTEPCLDLALAKITRVLPREALPPALPCNSYDTQGNDGAREVG
jgi:hypothetical protein